MERSFLFLILLALTTNVAFAQIPPQAMPQAAKEKTDFQKFTDRLRIGYFGIFTSPTLEDIENGKWQYAASSPEFQTFDRNRDSYSTNMWNQVSFNYNFGAKMNFVVNPRFTTFFVRPGDKTTEQSIVTIEDLVVGFQGVVYKSEDKKFNLFLAPVMRLPTSRAIRDGNNPEFGRVTRQLQLGYSPTYDFNPTWQLGIFGAIRMWVYEQRYNPLARLRFSTSPYVQYAFNDFTRLQIYYNNIIENQRRWKTQNGKDPVFKDYWQDISVGINHDVTPKLNIYPFISMYVNEVALSNDSVWFGAWVSYQIK